MKNKHQLFGLAAVTCAATFALAVSLAWPALRARATGGLFQISGTFNNSAMSVAADGNVNGCDSTTDYQGVHPGGYAAYGAYGCTIAPNTSTNLEAGGVVGSVKNSSIVTNGVGGAFYAVAGGDGTGTADNQRVKNWGINPLVADNGFNHQYLLNEFDFNITGPDTKVIGFTMVGASTHTPAAGSAAFVLGELGPGISWGYGFICADDATQVCYQAGPVSTGNNADSQAIRLISRASNGAIHFDDLTLEAGGNLKIQPFGGSAVWINKDGTIKAKGYTTY